MANHGWFAVKHGITSHPLFKGKPDRLAIWIWMLDNAAYADTPHDVNGKTVMVPRGSVCVSLRRLADEAGVGVQVVRTFLKRLQSEHMINTQVTHGRTIVSLCNYEKYQSPQKSANTGGNTRLTHDQHIKEQDNNIPVGTGPKIDPAKVMFDQGIQILGTGGVAERKARSVLGKWKKEYGAAAVIEALGRAQREGAIDPVPFIEGSLRYAKRKGASTGGGLGKLIGSGG